MWPTSRSAGAREPPAREAKHVGTSVAGRPAEPDAPRIAIPLSPVAAARRHRDSALALAASEPGFFVSPQPPVGVVRVVVRRNYHAWIHHSRHRYNRPRHPVPGIWTRTEWLRLPLRRARVLLHRQGRLQRHDQVRMQNSRDLHRHRMQLLVEARQTSGGVDQKKDSIHSMIPAPHRRPRSDLAATFRQRGPPDRGLASSTCD